MAISTFPASGGAAAKEKRIERFTSTGSWTAPSGVDFVIARIVSGGGGGGGISQSNGSSGSQSGFDGTNFPAGRGGVSVAHPEQATPVNGNANTGQGGSGTGSGFTSAMPGNDGVQSEPMFFGQSVTPAGSYTVTVGSGGSGGTSGGNGGSGFVELEYYVSP